jgi:hypothetical protein
MTRYPIADEETFIDIFGDAFTVNYENGYFFFRTYQGDIGSEFLAAAAFTLSQMHEIHAHIGRLLGLTFTESGKRLDLPAGYVDDSEPWQ